MKSGSNALLSAAETADMLDMNVETLYRQWRSLGLPGLYIGRKLKFRLGDVESWIERKIEEAA